MAECATGGTLSNIHHSYSRIRNTENIREKRKILFCIEVSKANVPRVATNGYKRNTQCTTGVPRRRERVN